jgi:hypothetical protein
MAPHHQILRVLEDYFGGINAGDVQRLRSAFHPSAVLWGEVKGCPMLGFDYVDFLSLLREDGRWAIVAKLFTHLALDALRRVRTRPAGQRSSRCP